MMSETRLNEIVARCESKADSIETARQIRRDPDHGG